MATAMGEDKDELSFGPFRLIVSERLLTRKGVPVELGARALDILIALVSTPNEVINKKNLMSRVWPDVVVEEGSLRFHMASLRKVLGDGQDGARFITTIPGRGSTTISRYQNGWHRGWPISGAGLSVLPACSIAAPAARSSRSSSLIVSGAGASGGFLSNGSLPRPSLTAMST